MTGRRPSCVTSRTPLPDQPGSAQCNPSRDIPRQLALYLNGNLKLDELITARYPLDQVAQGYQDLKAGKNLRGIITFS